MGEKWTLFPICSPVMKAEDKNRPRICITYSYALVYYDVYRTQRCLVFTNLFQVKPILGAFWSMGVKSTQNRQVKSEPLYITSSNTTRHEEYNDVYLGV